MPPVCKTITLSCGCNRLKDWTHAARAVFMESLLATEDVYGAGGGTAAGGVEGITARSLSAADE